MTDPDLAATLAALTTRLDEAEPFNIGFPGATDFDYGELAHLLAGRLLNNIGDPYVDGVAANHTKSLEREVITFFADLFRAPADDRWGYVTTGGSEGNLYGLWLARTLHPDGVVYHSTEAHPSVAKAANLLGLTTITVRADPCGEIDYTDLAEQIGHQRDRPAIVVANIGTTMAEAVDDVRRIVKLLDGVAVRRRFVHADAALSGIPLGLLDPTTRPGFDMADGADSITVSGHKFLGVPMPCGVVVTRRSVRNRLAAATAYTGSPDTTLAGSRNGHTPLMMWCAIVRHGLDGLSARAEQARALAVHLHRRLAELRWPVSLNPHAVTVVLQTPPDVVMKKWVLASHNGHSHVITVPGMDAETIDAFLTDMAVALNTTGTTGSVPLIPPQRIPEPEPTPAALSRPFRRGR